MGDPPKAGGFISRGKSIKIMDDLGVPAFMESPHLSTKISDRMGKDSIFLTSFQCHWRFINMGTDEREPHESWIRCQNQTELELWRCAKIGVAPVIIHLRFGFSLTKTIQFRVPPWRAGNPHVSPPLFSAWQQVAEAKRGKVIENQKEAFARPGMACVDGKKIVWMPPVVWDKPCGAGVNTRFCHMSNRQNYL